MYETKSEFLNVLTKEVSDYLNYDLPPITEVTTQC